jgi:hypothetical protein
LTWDYRLSDFTLIPSPHSARRAADSPSAVDSASAQIEVVDRRPVVRPARHRTHEQELVEHELTVVEVAFGETIGGFQVERE